MSTFRDFRPTKTALGLKVWPVSLSIKVAMSTDLQHNSDYFWRFWTNRDCFWAHSEAFDLFPISLSELPYLQTWSTVWLLWRCRTNRDCQFGLIQKVFDLLPHFFVRVAMPVVLQHNLATFGDSWTNRDWLPIWANSEDVDLFPYIFISVAISADFTHIVGLFLDNLDLWKLFIWDILDLLSAVTVWGGLSFWTNLRGWETLYNENGYNSVPGSLSCTSKVSATKIFSIRAPMPLKTIAINLNITLCNG